MRDRMLKERKQLSDLVGPDFQKKYLELIRKQGNKSTNTNDKTQNKSINKPPFASTSSYLFENDKSSSKQAVIKRDSASLELTSQARKSLNLEKLVENVRRLNEQNPLSLLRFQVKNITQINRIYLLSYFRSGSSFLGDLLQQNYRTFYEFEPLHFRSVASRLPSNESRTDASIALVLHMVNQCNFHGKATANYLNWISKEDNRFLLSWNHFLYGLCRFNQSRCSDAKFVEHVCNLAEQRVTKLTRVNLSDLIKVLRTDNTLEEHIKQHLKLNATFAQYDLSRLNFRISKQMNSTNSKNNSNTNHPSSQISSQNSMNNSLINSQNNQISSTSSTGSTSPISTPNIVLNNKPLTLEVEPIKIIYLVRDPRAIYSSRQHLGWCKNRGSCANIDKLCDEMNQDFRTFESLYSSFRTANGSVLTLTNDTTKYPIQLFLVRFESVALDPLNSTTELFKLVNLPFKENIKRFVYSHTASNLESKDFKTPFKKWYYLNKVSNDPHSTKRNSTRIPFDWIHKLNWPKIDEIQTKCKYSMDRLGYKRITNEQFKQNPKNLTDLLLIKQNSFTLF